MTFSKNIVRSFVDLPNHLSLVIHSIGCNLHCHGCFNYENLVSNPQDVCDEEYILKDIRLNGYLSDAIIFSGGEFLNNNISDIEIFLSEVRNVFDGIIIINTNGTFPDKMRAVFEKGVVDGFHTDLKLPFYMMGEYDDDLMLRGLGVRVNIEEILHSIEYTIASDKGYSQVRSVMYPFVQDSVFEENKKYIEMLNTRYNKNTPYFINPFVERG